MLLFEDFPAAKLKHMLWNECVKKLFICIVILTAKSTDDILSL